MGMNITQMPCNPGNYTAKRSSAIRYLVVQYTGVPGTARNNGAAAESSTVLKALLEKFDIL